MIVPQKQGGGHNQNNMNNKQQMMNQQQMMSQQQMMMNVQGMPVNKNGKLMTQQNLVNMANINKINNINMMRSQQQSGQQPQIVHPQMPMNFPRGMPIPAQMKMPPGANPYQQMQMGNHIGMNAQGIPGPQNPG